MLEKEALKKETLEKNVNVKIYFSGFYDFMQFNLNIRTKSKNRLHKKID